MPDLSAVIASGAFQWRKSSKPSAGLPTNALSRSFSADPQPRRTADAVARTPNSEWWSRGK
jgi:hypothetical protein